MGIETKLHRRSGVVWYYIRFEGPDGRRVKEKAGVTRQQAKRLLRKRSGEVFAGTYVNPRGDGRGAMSKSWTEAVDDVRRDWRALLRSILYALGIFKESKRR